MTYGIVNKPAAVIYEGPYQLKPSAADPGRFVSAIADEGLYGMMVVITGAQHQGYVPVRTFYGYEGYMDAADLIVTDESRNRAWEDSHLMVVNGTVTDVLSVPRVQGVCLLSLYRGSLIQVEALEAEEPGWARVRLADGRTGYIRSQCLLEKRFSQAGIYQAGNSPLALPQGKIPSEARFRQGLVRTAESFLGTQYRWGGRSSAGIDCSGLTSVSYMLNGILIYRDAKIVEGYPVHEIPAKHAQTGDLLYFPGHIALYIGEQRYIHSTGKVGSGGVVINSLNPAAPDYREDLAESLYAVGSVF